MESATATYDHIAQLKVGINENYGKKIIHREYEGGVYIGRPASFICIGGLYQDIYHSFLKVTIYNLTIVKDVLADEFAWTGSNNVNKKKMHP